MSSAEVNPALVATIVEQVLSALQGMNIGGSPATIAPNVESDAHVSDGEDDGHVVQFLGHASSPVPSDLETASGAAASPAASVTQPAAPSAEIPNPVPELTMGSAPVAAPAAVIPSGVTVSHGSWYMVSTGLAVGVFRGWHIVSPLVIGVAGACYKKYPSEAAARAAFEEAEAANVVNVVT